MCGEGEAVGMGVGVLTDVLVLAHVHQCSFAAFGGEGTGETGRPSEKKNSYPRTKRNRRPAGQWCGEACLVAGTFVAGVRGGGSCRVP